MPIDSSVMPSLNSSEERKHFAACLSKSIQIQSFHRCKLGIVFEEFLLLGKIKTRMIAKL